MTIGREGIRAPGWVAAAALTLALVACGSDPQPPGATRAATEVEPQAFLARHWARPLVPQGEPPPGFGPLEASLAPEACGGCHQRQFEEWRTTLHSRAMGPGILGQLQEMDPEAADDHQACLRCHAPLAEQAADLRHALASAPGGVAPRADGAAYTHGLSCAGCHLRGHRRFGPPRRDGSPPEPAAPLPHDGWEVAAAFEDSRFCAACHQFEADGYGLNGKLLENTYEEWRASRHGRENRSCQSCHMPDRRHLWRGIHDPAMVRSGLDIDASAPAVAGGRVTAELRIASRNVGHAFPTYVTPQVVVEIGQLDADGAPLETTIDRQIIAREVSPDLATERFDTRIMPDEVRRYGYDRPLAREAVRLSMRIRVEPDAFYAGFYRTTLRDAGFTTGQAAIAEALRRAEASAYVLYEASWQLPPSDPAAAARAGS